MKNYKLGLLTSTICLLIAILLLTVSFAAPYTNAYEDTDITNISEMVFQFDSQEVKNVYDLNRVKVVINGNPKYVLTHRTDIGRLLEDLGVIIDKNKKIVSTSDEIVDGTVVRVITVGTVIEELNIDIPFNTKEENTKEIPFGKRETVQEGVLGVRTKNIRKIYEDGRLVSEVVLSDEITREPVSEIIQVGVLRYSPDDLDVRYGYNCEHWYSVVDNGPYSDQEKQFLKFLMYCESGCNAESDKHDVYKGLFQWNPKSWNAYYPKDNIYDGYAQIENTIDKIRRGVSLSAYWPACYKQYVQKFGEFIR